MTQWNKRQLMAAFTAALAALLMGPLAGDARAQGFCSWQTVATFGSGYTPTTFNWGGATGSAYPLAYVPPGYHTLPGTSYVSITPTGFGAEGSLATYYATLSVPEGVPGHTRGRHFILQFHADNYAHVYLHTPSGRQHIYSQTHAEVESNFQNPADTFVRYSFPVYAYDYVLEFQVGNFTYATGLDYLVTIEDEQCECDLSDPRQPICPL